MKITFTVHTVYDLTVNRLVSVGGKSVSAAVPSVAVELVDDSGQSYSRHFIGNDGDAAKATFKTGQKVVADFE